MAEARGREGTEGGQSSLLQLANRIVLAMNENSGADDTDKAYRAEQARTIILEHANALPPADPNRTLLLRQSNLTLLDWGPSEDKANLNQIGYMYENGININAYIGDSDQRPAAKVSFSAARDYAVRKNRIIEDCTASSLLPGKAYTFIVMKDGRIICGEYENIQEMGTKHASLANKSGDVFGGGEVRLDADGKINFNTESGTYNRVICNNHRALGFSNGDDCQQKLKDQFGALFSSPGRPAEYLKTIISGLPQKYPNESETKEYCLEIAGFCSSNVELCRGLTPANRVDPCP